MSVLVLMDDLIFSTKIEAAARQLGVVICLVANPNQLNQALREKTFRLAIIDLNSSNDTAMDGVRSIHGQLPHLPILGFCSHVQRQLQKQALAAGCSRVVPRSVFVQQLPDLLMGNQ